MPQNIKPILERAGVELEKRASDAFGASADDFTRGISAGPTLDPTPRPAGGSARDFGTFYSSSYAAALSGGTSYRPKMKFLFKVEFIFTAKAIEQFPSILGGAHSQDFTFMVKAIDRPKIDFEYEDDVNMYNFRTKALKKIRHRELTVTFMDDVGNRVLDLFKALMMIHSPITRRQQLREKASTYAERIAPPDPDSINDSNGMMFSDPNESGYDDSAIRGAFNSNVGSIIKTIRVKQMYVDPSAGLGGAVKETIFDFLNARLVSFDLDDLTHETSDVNLMTMQFDYDWMEIVHVGSLESVDTPVYNITVPGVNGAPSDISPSGLPMEPQGGGNRFLQPGDLGGSTQTLTPSLAERSVQSSPGGNTHASKILGSTVNAGLKSSISSAVDQGQATFGVVKNLITAPKTSAASVATVFDSALGGRTPVKAIVTKLIS